MTPFMVHWHHCTALILILCTTLWSCCCPSCSAQQWSMVQFGTSGSDSGRSIVIDSTMLYVTGFTGANLGVTHAGLDDVFVRKLSAANGAEVWTVQFGTPNNDYGYSIAVDSTNVYVAGYTQGSLVTPNAGSYDIFIRKLSATNGAEAWTVQFGTSGGDYGNSVAIDSTYGFLYLTGYTTGNLAGTNTGSSDIFIRKLSATNGAEAWTVQFGTSGDDVAYSVAIDSTYVYVVGYTLGSLGGTNAGLSDVFVRKLSLANGAEVWTVQIGTSGDEFGYNIAIDLAQANLFVTGFTQGSLSGVNSGSYDVFMRRLSTATGAALSTIQFGTATTDYGRAVAADSNSVYVTGDTSGVLGATSAGAADAFVRNIFIGGACESTVSLPTSGGFSKCVECDDIKTRRGSGRVCGSCAPGSTTWEITVDTCSYIQAGSVELILPYCVAGIACLCTLVLVPMFFVQQTKKAGNLDRFTPTAHILLSLGDFLSDVLYFATTKFAYEYLKVLCFVFFIIPLLPPFHYWIKSMAVERADGRMGVPRVFDEHSNMNKVVLEVILWPMRVALSALIFLSMWVSKLVAWTVALRMLERFQGFSFVVDTRNTNNASTNNNNSNAQLSSSAVSLSPVNSTENGQNDLQSKGGDDDGSQADGDFDGSMYSRAAFFECFLETIPQIAIQVTNTVLIQQLSTVFIISMAFSAYIALYVVYDFFYRVAVAKQELFSATTSPSPATKTDHGGGGGGGGGDVELQKTTNEGVTLAKSGRHRVSLTTASRLRRPRDGAESVSLKSSPKDENGQPPVYVNLPVARPRRVRASPSSLFGDDN